MPTSPTASRGGPLALDVACRAELHTSLGRLLSSGFPADKAIETSGEICGGGLRDALARAAIAVQKGVGMTRALDLAGLLLPSDRALLSAGESAGCIDCVFDELGSRYDAAQARARAVQAKLWLPAAVLALGLFLAPLPALVGGRIDAAAYAGRTLGVLALLVVGVKSAMAAWRRYHRTGWPAPLAAALDRLPLWGTVQRGRGRSDALSNVHAMLNAGVPAAQALAGIARAEPNPCRAKELHDATKRLRDGRSVAESLRDAALLDAGAFAVVQAGEAAGRLEESLSRSVRQSSSDVDSRLDTLAEWLPRIVYGCVAAWIAVSVLTGGIGPS